MQRVWVRAGTTPERIAGRGQLMLQFDDAPSGAQPQPQLMVAEWLGYVVVRAHFHPGCQILVALLGCQEQYVDIGGLRRFPDIPAHFYPAQFRHHPVEYGEARRILGLQYLQGSLAVLGGDDVVSPHGELFFHELSKTRLVFRNQYSHDATS